MRIVLAPDSFKGSLDQRELCRVMHAAIAQVLPDARLIDFPLSDGGEGFASSLANHCQGRTQAYLVEDPLGRPVEAELVTLQDGTAVVEVACASGLQRLSASELNPMRASSFGSGQLIAQALSNGSRRLLLGLGGSATNDGGAGLLAALGMRFLDSQGREIPRGAEGLPWLQAISLDQLLPGFRQCQIVVACDVDNPLLGEQGASRVFGPQKGASPAQLVQLEQALEHFNAVMQGATGRCVANTPGAGAAGGIAAALMAFTDAQFRPGFDIVSEQTGFEAVLRDSRPDLVITGEGRFDEQSMRGKLPCAVAKLAKKYHVPVALITGQSALSQAAIKQAGFNSAEILSETGEPIEQAMAMTEQRLAAAAQSLVKSFVKSV